MINHESGSDPNPVSTNGPADEGPPLGQTTAEPVSVIDADLAAGTEGRLVRYTHRVRLVVRLLAAVIGATGLFALIVAVPAWRDSVPAQIVVVVLCLPAVLLPIYVVRRTGALADAAAHPGDVADQARGLLSGLSQSQELSDLAGLLKGGSESGRRLGLRRAFGLARSASAVVGQAQPDEERHPLLVPFTPERLARTWAATIWSLWAWALASLVLVVSIPVLILSLF